MKDDFSGLNKLTENVKKLEGQSEISLGTLFNDGFLQSNTNFQNIDELFEKAGFKVETPEDFDAIPQEEIDQFIRENTKYESFSDLQTKAVTEYVRKNLLSGLK
ncbi:hypothetical protein [Acinetobacter courvalinii]|uniref:Uncharacterized protein n=1 Tax=Acinetobacter courvalinii TaxID=280147 RepID=A0AA42I4N3_9GAMM|nr:hypothetical protein [Acinetobacter courvalinii]MDH0562169.1 hypothetical protein [Acinetobacter courvalinii]